MIVYNITIKIIHDIEEAWIQWQKEEHIPAIMATGLFSEYRFFRLLEHDDDEGRSFVLQLFAADIEQYQLYAKQYAPALQQQSLEKWGDRYIAFRTIMEVVN
jgi:hypothetical protein